MKHIFFATLVIIFSGCFGRKPEKTGLEGKEIPASDLLLEDSVTYYNTSSIPRGRSTVVFFFGPNCPFSHAQMEEILEDIEKLKDIQFLLLTISPFNQMKQFSNQYQLQKYTNIKVGLDYKRYFKDYFEVPGVPYIVIYGKDKKMRGAYIGKLYARQIKDVAER